MCPIIEMGQHWHGWPSHEGYPVFRAESQVFAPNIAVPCLCLVATNSNIHKDDIVLITQQLVCNDIKWAFA